MPEYRLSLDFTAADDAQVERLAEAWAGTCAAEYGTRMAGFERLGDETPRWQAMQARFLDQISDLYEHFDCDESCPHREGDRRAAAFASQYLKEIVHEEGFRPASSSYQPPTEGQR